MLLIWRRRISRNLALDILQVIVLAVLQGFTEFLPISSSGHLILVPVVLGWEDQGLAFDIAVHFGSLAAVVFYFRHDLVDLARSVGNSRAPSFRLAWNIIIATVPLVITGYYFVSTIKTELRSPLVIAATTIGFGILLWLADKIRHGTKSERVLGWHEAIAVGCGQALALIPGTSRSGVTITVGLALGLSREAAGRFSFLLAIPAILGAATWQLTELAVSPEPYAIGQLAMAAIASAIMSFITIALFLKLIGRIGMVWFAIYRLLLGAYLLYVFL